jgi:predicted nucleotidyltransferase component of viral defense system
MEEIYRKQVELLIRCLPEIEKQSCFALKGGTAINLFVRDMPRLSVDIDLVYLPLEARDETLINIANSLDEIAKNINTNITNSIEKTTGSEKHTSKLFIRHNEVQIKIEPNVVQRGSVYDVESRELCARAETEFEISATANTLAVSELYGSKINAALDRQHPRDLFDVMLLLQNEGITDDIRKAFIVYLVSHSRPMHELLNPNRLDIENTFKTQFEGMVNVPVKLQELLDSRP